MGRPLASRQASQISLAKKHREQISLAVESLLVRRVRRPSRIRRLPKVFSNRKMSLKEAKGRRSGVFLSFSD